MSRHNEEENEENECFYESLDRIASSSASCSTSNSESDSEPSNLDLSTSIDDLTTDNNDDNSFLVPRFPMGVSKFDIWIPEPASVSERRTRLLREMGLSRDLSLSRETEKDGGENGVSDFSRSVSSDGWHRKDRGETSGCGGMPGILRSKSDGSVCQSNGGGGGDRNRDRYHQRHCNCNCNSCSISAYTSSIHSIRSLPETSGDKLSTAFVNSSCCCKCVLNVVVDDDNPVLDASKWMESKNNGGSVAFTPQNQNKPPIGKTNVNDQVCTIKNLDTGKEFVLNEIKEDGTCNKMKEVGTGRQLTMEEFEMCVGHSPIVQELMRRQNVEEGGNGNGNDNGKDNSDFDPNMGVNGGGMKLRKKASWLKSIKSVANSVTGHRDRRSSDDKDTSSEKGGGGGGRRSSSATDDSQDVGSFHGPERVRVRQYGKSCKELTALYKSQEIQAHKGFIWTIKFSLDGRYLASAGEDCVIHVWQVVESEKKGELLIDKPKDGVVNMLLLANGSPELSTLSPRRKSKHSISRKSVSLDHIVVPDTLFALSEKPFCSFQGHLHDVLDLSWSKSQHLLSSSMDKTVRLWHLSSKTCLKIFSHSDYVTCIQFNPVDDRYFISGSLDAKVRIWSIPDRQVVDWNDLHEMVTAACYTPDGQGALVGSYKGSCRMYNTSDNKLQQRSQINLQNKKKKSHHKKITGFQFTPGSSSEVLITSADSRVRVIDGVHLVHKFKGFRNTNSQISATLSGNGKYVVSASEDSCVYIWKHKADSQPSRCKGVTVTRSYEHFHCQDVSVAIPWPGMGEKWGMVDDVSTANHPPTPVDNNNGNNDVPRTVSGCTNCPLNGIISSATNGYFFDRFSATWPEEKLGGGGGGGGGRGGGSPRASVDSSNGLNPNMSAWSMVIVTAGLRGEIRSFQNFGLPVRI